MWSISSILMEAVPWRVHVLGVVAFLVMVSVPFLLSVKVDTKAGPGLVTLAAAR